jgi:hypothetical protein
MPGMASATGYHHRATFAEGPRRPLTKREKAEAKARFDHIRRTEPGFTPHHVIVLSWLVDRVGYDGRCDPSHATIAEATGISISTVKRAIQRAVELGIMTSTMRLIRAGGRVLQRTCAYLFRAKAEPMPVVDKVVKEPGNPPEMSVAQNELEPSSSDLESSFLAGKGAVGAVDNSPQSPEMARIEAARDRVRVLAAQRQQESGTE